MQLCTRRLSRQWKWGSYRVLETRLFDRFDGLDFEDNVCNFLRMVVEGDNGNASVIDLLRTLQRGIGKPPVPAVASAPPVAPVHPPAILDTDQAVLPVPVHPALQFAHFRWPTTRPAKNCPHWMTAMRPQTRSTPGEGYYGLSEVFFVNRTPEQDQVMIGIMFVEGVAGSGKTSAGVPNCCATLMKPA